jgi:alpha,alpha-trehalase
MITFHHQAKKLLLRLSKQTAVPGRTSQEMVEARQYINAWWAHVTRYHPHSSGTLLGLPKPYLVPSYDAASTFDYEEMYYWDSYFIAQGLLDNEHKALVTGMLENLLYLLKNYQVIPNASRTYLMGRSQPPLLTSFIFNVYDSFHPSDVWLKKAIDLAEGEYHAVWMGIKKPNDRCVYRGLSRYYDINVLHDLAEAESGWDMTPRFKRHALNYLPVDLNALLYGYEMDFARAAQIFQDKPTATAWRQKAQERAATMNELMWDESRGLFMDYNYARQRRGNVNSLAAYYPMWMGMASESQAAALVHSLKRFEFRGGLATTDAWHVGNRPSADMPTQWAYPNGWAPLHLIVVQGLERYGYHEEAQRIVTKWLGTNLSWFTQHGEFLEKYNVVNPDQMPVEGVYPTQKGFGWSNGVFERFCRDYIDTAK